MINYLKKIFENKITLIIFVLMFFSVFVVFSLKNDYHSEYFGYKNYVKGFSTGAEVIPWNTEEGKNMLLESMKNKNAETFFSLAHHFAGQKTNSTCGPATARMIIEAIYEHQNKQFLLDEENSFYKKKNGVDSAHFVISERNFFNVYKGKEDGKNYDIISRQRKNREGIFYGGMDIQPLGEVMALYSGINVETKVVKPDDMTAADINNFRKIVKKVTSSSDSYIIVNYYLKAMYDKDSGHFSPIAAYNERKDMVLIMDVATHLGVWTWVKLEEIYRDMNSEISDCNRGYLVITEKKIQ